MNFESYFSNLSCFEEFEIKCSLLGKKKNDPEILNCFQKIESWYFLIVGRKICFLDQNGNKVKGKDVKLKGDFYVSYSEIESLEGSPKEVEGNFYCDHCPNLKSFEGCSEKVGGNFWCVCCQNLKSLEGSPKEVGGYFYCDHCSNLRSLKGCPKKVEGNFYCYDCLNLPINEIPDCKIGGEFRR